MSGFQYWNSNGALMIDSNYKGTYYQDSMEYQNITDIGFTKLKQLLEIVLIWDMFPINFLKVIASCGSSLTTERK